MRSMRCKRWKALGPAQTRLINIERRNSRMSAAKTTLPKLLAGLPKYGHGQLVQPTSWKAKYPNSFYKITRTKLRFQQVDEAGKPIAAAGVVDKGKAKEQPKDEDEFDEDNEDGDIFGGLAEEEATVQQTGGRPHGKAWGVLFWNGELQRRSSSIWTVELTMSRLLSIVQVNPRFRPGTLVNPSLPMHPPRSSQKLSSGGVSKNHGHHWIPLR